MMLDMRSWWPQEGVRKVRDGGRLMEIIIRIWWTGCIMVGLGWTGSALDIHNAKYLLNLYQCFGHVDRSSYQFDCLLLNKYFGHQIKLFSGHDNIS